MPWLRRARGQWTRRAGRREDPIPLNGLHRTSDSAARVGHLVEERQAAVSVSAGGGQGTLPIMNSLKPRGARPMCALKMIFSCAPRRAHSWRHFAQRRLKWFDGLGRNPKPRTLHSEPFSGFSGQGLPAGRAELAGGLRAGVGRFHDLCKPKNINPQPQPRNPQP